VIAGPSPRHVTGVVSLGTALPAPLELCPAEEGTADEARARLERVVRENFQLVWRTLRRLVPPDSVDDAVQQVFIVLSRKLDHVDSGSERAFLLRTALWVAHHVRRKRARAREVISTDAIAEHADPRPLPDETADERDRRRLLDAVLDGMSTELREVFVLFELEGLSSVAIAPLLGIPVGTVASRLRRSRAEFHLLAKRLRAKGAPGGWR
jgi:RNA polymerase sigma-70 factor (ECF subfamily)